MLGLIRTCEGKVLLDISPWLEPVDAANPSGVSLRDHPSFHEIERLMEPRVEVMRDERNRPVSEVPIPVDWSEVLAKSEELRRHGRDLRLLVIVARAHANERGLAGLADGLMLVARTLEAHWETLHPELRTAATARDAALRRISALVGLQMAKDGLLGDLRSRVFFDLRGLGPVTGLDLERATLDFADGARRSGGDQRGDAGRGDRQARGADRSGPGLARRTCRPGRRATRRADRGGPCGGGRHRGGRGRAGGRLDGGTYLPDLKRFLGRVLATLDRPAPGATPRPRLRRRDRGGGPRPGRAPAPVAAAIWAFRDDHLAAGGHRLPRSDHRVLRPDRAGQPGALPRTSDAADGADGFPRAHGGPCALGAEGVPLAGRDRRQVQLAHAR